MSFNVPERGFLLADALIAMALLTAGLLAAAESFQFAGRSAERARARTLVALCAQERLAHAVTDPSPGACAANGVVWTETRMPWRDGWETAQWTARFGKDGYPYEESFETFVRAR